LRVGRTTLCGTFGRNLKLLILKLRRMQFGRKSEKPGASALIACGGAASFSAKHIQEVGRR